MRVSILGKGRLPVDIRCVVALGGGEGFVGSDLCHGETGTARSVGDGVAVVLDLKVLGGGDVLNSVDD